MQYKNLKIMGSSHIARESVNEVKHEIETLMPDIVAIELDNNRYHALLSNKKDKIRFYDIKRIGLKGWLFSLFGAWAENKLGKAVGVKPGSEMIAAIKLVKKYKLKVALIDQDIEITLKKLSKAIKWREKWNFLVDIIKGVVFRKKQVDFDLTKVPSQEVIDKLISQVKDRYPSIYRILVKERNVIMAKNLARLMQNNPDKKILAIVGAGHEEDMMKIIKGDHPTITYTYNLG